MDGCVGMRGLIDFSIIYVRVHGLVRHTGIRVFAYAYAAGRCTHIRCIVYTPLHQVLDHVQPGQVMRVRTGCSAVPSHDPVLVRIVGGFVMHLHVAMQY